MTGGAAYVWRVGVFRSRGLIIGIVVVVIIALAGGSVAFFLSSRTTSQPPVEQAEVMKNLPEAELLWFSQPQEIKDEVCGGLATTPDEYYALMKETWLQEADMEPALFGALMTTIINDCGL